MKVSPASAIAGVAAMPARRRERAERAFDLLLI
jgi:hypothetical protein